MDLEKMTIKELTELYNSMTNGKKIKKFESKAKAIARVKKLLPEKKERKVTKMGIIREMFPGPSFMDPGRNNEAHGL
jgi:hypothetical protein